MKINFDPEMQEYLDDQARLQAKDTETLVKQLVRRCRELHLIESMSTTVSEQWGNEPI